MQTILETALDKIINNPYNIQRLKQLHVRYVIVTIYRLEIAE